MENIEFGEQRQRCHIVRAVRYFDDFHAPMAMANGEIYEEMIFFMVIRFDWIVLTADWVLLRSLFVGKRMGFVQHLYRQPSI